MQFECVMKVQQYALRTRHAQAREAKAYSSALAYKVACRVHFSESCQGAGARPLALGYKHEALGGVARVFIQ